MQKINLIIIFFLFLFVIIDGTDEDLFDDLWKNLKPPTPKNFKNQKFGEIKTNQEIVVKNEKYEQENAKKIEIDDIKPKELQKKPFKEQNNNLKIKIKESKIEMEQMSEESFENEFDEEADQNVWSADLSNSDDEDYNDMKEETRNEMEILNKFNLMKMELRKESVYKNLTLAQFEREIAKKLGTNRKIIYKLKKKLGQIRERTEESKETKMELIRKFDELKKEKIYGFKFDSKQRNKIEKEIAIEMGISRDKIYKWKKEFGLLKRFSNQQKLEKIEQFEKVKEEFTKKFNLKTNYKIETKIAKKLGVVWDSIYNWKRKFGLITQKAKTYTDAEKLNYLKISEEMKKGNPMISERKITERLGIPSHNLRRWTKKFGTKSNN